MTIFKRFFFKIYHFLLFLSLKNGMLYHMIPYLSGISFTIKVVVIALRLIVLSFVFCLHVVLNDCIIAKFLVFLHFSFISPKKVF